MSKQARRIGINCALYFFTCGSAINEANEFIVKKLPALLEATYTFVNPTVPFEAHEVCSNSEWLNGQSNPLEESYHPNVSGQAEFQTLIEGVL